MSLSPENLRYFAEKVLSKTGRPHGVRVSVPLLPPEGQGEDEIIVLAKSGNRSTVYRSLKCEEMRHGAVRAFDYVQESAESLIRDALSSPEVVA